MGFPSVSISCTREKEVSDFVDWLLQQPFKPSSYWLSHFGNNGAQKEHTETKNVVGSQIINWIIRNFNTIESEANKLYGTNAGVRILLCTL